MSYIPLEDCFDVTLEELAPIVRDSCGFIHHVYAHWSAGHYSQAYDDYHICIDYNGKVYLTAEDMTETLAHTWRRNLGAIGVSMMCAYEAEARNGYNAYFGPEPPTDIQITALSQVTAVLSEELNLPLDSDHFMTHYEAACLDGYGVPYGTYVNGVYQGDPDSRWDLWYLPDPNQGGLIVPGGDLWRGIANFYKEGWKK